MQFDFKNNKELMMKIEMKIRGEKRWKHGRERNQIKNYKKL